MLRGQNVQQVVQNTFPTKISRKPWKTCFSRFSREKKKNRKSKKNLKNRKNRFFFFFWKWFSGADFFPIWNLCRIIFKITDIGRYGLWHHFSESFIEIKWKEKKLQHLTFSKQKVKKRKSKQMICWNRWQEGFVRSY